MTTDAVMPAGGGLRSVGLVAQLTWLDFMRRKDFYVVAVFMGVFVVGALAVRVIGVESAHTARFLMSLGLNVSHLLGAFLAASFSARAFPEEFDRGTLSPLLAKPVSRVEVMAGKCLTSGGIALGGYLLFSGATLLAVPTVAGQRFLAFIQVFGLHCASLLLLSAMATALSLRLATVVAALVSLLWYVGAGFAINLVRESVRLRYAGAAGYAERALSCLPDATLLGQVETFAQGAGPLPWGLWVGLLFYGLGWAAVFYIWAAWLFGRMRV